jgi:hypothetical protein
MPDSDSDTASVTSAEVPQKPQVEVSIDKSKFTDADKSSIQFAEKYCKNVWKTYPKLESRIKCEIGPMLINSHGFNAL